MFRNRSVVEIMVLVFTLTVAVSILAAGATITIAELSNPDADTARPMQALLSLITGILGALLGLMAGKTGDLHSRPDHTDDEIGRQ